MTADAVYDPTAQPRHYDFSDTPAPEVPSTLDDLRAALAASEQAAEEAFPTHVLYGPGKFIRITCSTELDHDDWKRIQMAAIPQQYRGNRRRGGIPDVRKLNEAVAWANLIGQQAVEVAIRVGDTDEYKPIEHTGDDGPFSDPKLLAQFGAAEPGVAVRNIFVKDPFLLHAGTELQNACGYGERRPGEPADEDESDPT